MSQAPAPRSGSSADHDPVGRRSSERGPVPSVFDATAPGGVSPARTRSPFEERP
ncbi:hypothetical protein [Streptomyces sp. NPDC005953]|uniref:hypothetical protein n=1 Tax=Streptomyces sp. NPDC005953 TaxID=3156719 RepID=UPI0033CEA2AB